MPIIVVQTLNGSSSFIPRPQSNGYVESLDRALLDERFRVAYRTNFYVSVHDMEKDFQVYIKFYNNERSHQGRNMNRRTPYQFFLDGIRELKQREDQYSKLS